MTQSSSSPAYLPEDLYLDTSLVVPACIEGMQESAACAAFCDRLLAHGTRIYFSQILWVELSQVFRNLATDSVRTPEHLRAQFRLADWQRSSVREAWFSFCMRQFEAFLDQFSEVYEFPITPDVRHPSVQIMARYAMKSHDAIHAATAVSIGLSDFATLDRADFTKFAEDARLLLWP